MAKTKELAIQTKRNDDVTPLTLNNQTVEIIDHFKYLGTIIDYNFSFNQHSEAVFKRANQRLFLIRKPWPC